MDKKKFIEQNDEKFINEKNEKINCLNTII